MNKTTEALKLAEEALARLIGWLEVRDMLVAGAEREALAAIRTCLEQVSDVSQETEAEALAEQEKRAIADSGSEVSSETEAQEPVACTTDGECRIRCKTDGTAEHYDMPVAWAYFSDGKLQAIESGEPAAPYGESTATPLYAAPVSATNQEPVAWVNNESVQKLRECGWSDEAIATVVPTINLGAPVDAKAIQFALANARAEALEEAAKVCEQIDTAAFGSERPAPKDCATAIRGLK